jgi:hypothetical protein
MKDIKERSEGVTSDIANLCLLHKSLIKEIGRILFFAFFFLFFSVLLIIFCLDALLSLDRRARDVETHLDQLIRTRSSFPTAVLCASRRLGIGVAV